MESSIRILILEDNPADAELLLFELTEAGIACDAKVVGTEEDYIEGIETFSPDLILSDYDLPRYTGALALAEAKQRCPDVPFILVTGAVSEERAIEILTSGAKDFVMKGRLAKIGPAARRALAEAEEHRARKKAEADLRKAHGEMESRVARRTAELQAVLDAAPIAIWIAHDPQCRAITGNTYANEVIMQAPRGGNISRSAAPAEAAVSYRVYRGGVELNPEEMPAQVATATGRPVMDAELELVFSDRRRVHLLEAAVPLFEAGGQVRGAVVTAADITARKQVEDELRQSEARQRLILEASSLGTFEVDLETGWTHWNATEFELLGLTPGDLPDGPDTFFRYVHPDDLAMLRGQWEKAKKTGTLDSAEFRILRADGQERWLAGRGRFFSTGSNHGDDPANGEALRFVGVNFDITERKRAEEEAARLLAAVREEKEKLAALLNSIDDEIWFADNEKRFVLANQAALREFRLDARDGSSVSALASSLEVYRSDGSLRPVDEAPPLRALAGEVVRNEEEITRTPARGTWRYRQVSASPVRDAAGRIVGSVSVVRDVTEGKKMEEALRKSREEYRELIESCGSVILRTDSQLRITFMNRYGLRFFGYSEEEIIGRSALETIIPPRDSKGHDLEEMVRDLMVNPEKYPVNVHQNRCKDGRLVWMSWTNKPLYDEQGSFEALLVIGNDISPFKSREEAPDVPCGSAAR